MYDVNSKWLKFASKHAWCELKDDIMVYFNVIMTQKTLTFVSGSHNLDIDNKDCVRIPIANKEATAHCYIAWLKKNKPNLADILNWISKTCWE